MATKPRVTYRRPQPTTGRGRIVRQPANPFVSRGTLAGMRPPAVPKAAMPAIPGGGVPAAAAPQYSLASLPPDASYDAQIAQLQRQRDEGLAAIAGERARGLSDYGFTEGPNGTLAMDPNNAFSKAAVMKHTFDTNRRSTGQSMAAGGQLYAGAYQNAQDLVNRNELQSQDSLRKALINYLAGNTGRRTQALTGYETAAQQAESDRIARFQSNPLYDPSASADPGVPASPAAAAAAAVRRPVRNPWTSMGTLSRLRRK